jgi:hypothetical protein
VVKEQQQRLDARTFCNLSGLKIPQNEEISKRTIYPLPTNNYRLVHKFYDHVASMSRAHKIFSRAPVAEKKCEQHEVSQVDRSEQ